MMYNSEVFYGLTKITLEYDSVRKHLSLLLKKPKIEIFKRTGSLTKLQKAMGHSSLNVSLTYLLGLEVLN